MPILQALEITGKTAGNAVVEDAMADVIDSVKRGGTIAARSRTPPVFPAMVGHMVGVGEETGALDHDALRRSPTSTRTRSTRPSRR